ncbi:MAG: hypothetical protein EON98_02865 [Chitinophagaceae bacterium]|nr:MAG: hypothetical protein EON98_02865 [Chitinophagaceae bacterium]
MKNKFLAAVVFYFTVCGCRVENIGKDLSSGFSKSSEAIARNLMTGVNKGLSDSAFRQNLYGLVDSLLLTAGNGANRAAKNMIDSITSEKLVLFTARMVEEATGEKLKANLVALRNDLLGATTNERVRQLVETAVTSALNERTTAKIASLRDELLGDATNYQLSRLRDSLLGQRTAMAVKNILDSALKSTSTFLKTDLREGIDANASIIQKYAVRWLLLLGAIAAVIIYLVWRSKQKYAKTVTVLTSQINSIPDQKTYDELTSRIKDKAIETGVEPTLRKVLQDNGLMGKESWEAKQLKKASLARPQN